MRFAKVSRATWAIGFPLVCASRTASRGAFCAIGFLHFLHAASPLSLGVVYLKSFPTPRNQGKFNLWSCRHNPEAVNIRNHCCDLPHIPEDVRLPNDLHL